MLSYKGRLRNNAGGVPNNINNTRRRTGQNTCIVEYPGATIQDLPSRDDNGIVCDPSPGAQAGGAGADTATGSDAGAGAGAGCGGAGASRGTGPQEPSRHADCRGGRRPARRHSRVIDR